MQETNWKNEIEAIWYQLTSEEKALIKTYIRQLETENVSLKMVSKINRIHQKHPDFHVGCIPK